MNRSPSSHPSPPVGEKVPEGRLRGIRTGSWLQCTARPRSLFAISFSIFLATLLPPVGLVVHGAEIDAGALPAAAKATIDFDRDVKPIFESTCFRCHGPEKPKSHFRLDNRESALKGGDKFAGRSAEKSWLVGILKNKICDHFRKASRETSFTDMEFYSDEESDKFISEGLFKGGWIHELGPLEWSSDPGASLDSQAFWKTFHDCSNKMPKNIAAVFTLREVDGVESKEICKLLNISENNLWVMLHRARMALRRCLETNWFGKQT